ncbi:hypothetical protein AB833_09025 [Chromatiales bacterium (ex Bugula neritina AB1)]|nr:hypothetical protein AB833_09025 [Chromatiales bacterium (ex Bugula neritina AB1)]
MQLRVNQQAPIALDAKLNCDAGELMALVGPSGAGKSTLLRIIAGLMKPETGSISCAGQQWLDTESNIFLSAQQRRVGFVFQQYALFPHLSALQNVAQACRNLGKTQSHARAMHWLKKVNLDGLEARRPDQLSGGQQQRVGIARALAREPKVLLLDEPFSAVDRATRERLYRELATLRRELSIPAILVTHDLDEAIILSDQVSMLSQGTTLQSGSVLEVINRPISVLVARLVGFKNVFRGTVLDTSGENAIIEWRGVRLEVSRRGAFSAGKAIHWCIPQSHIVLHRIDRPSRGERENPIYGPVSSLLVMGDNTLVSVLIGNPDRPPLYFSVPTHVAERNQLREGLQIGFSLLADSIHLMPPDRIGRSRR